MRGKSDGAACAAAGAGDGIASADVARGGICFLTGGVTAEPDPALRAGLAAALGFGAIPAEALCEAFG